MFSQPIEWWKQIAGSPILQILKTWPGHPVLVTLITLNQTKSMVTWGRCQEAVIYMHVYCVCMHVYIHIYIKMYYIYICNVYYVHVLRSMYGMCLPTLTLKMHSFVGIYSIWVYLLRFPSVNHMLHGSAKGGSGMNRDVSWFLTRYNVGPPFSIAFSWWL